MIADSSGEWCGDVLYDAAFDCYVPMHALALCVIAAHAPVRPCPAELPSAGA